MQLRQRLVLVLSSAFGLGYLPKAPGTWGTLLGIPIWWALSPLAAPTFGLAVLVITLVAVGISELAERIYGRHDVQKIVIDEVVGLLVTAIGVPFRWQQVLPAFILFRLFDMTKPPPIRTLDEQVKGGLGVVVDDVAAGLVACGVLHAARWIYGGWW
jgi:phosphatidylglycerophosphatase A